MAYNNKLELEGNLCDDCAIYKDRVVRARLAVTRSRDGSKDPLYVNVSLFTDNADNLDRCYDKLVKGAHVRVRGTLDVSTYEDSEGYERTDVRMIADEIAMISNVFLPLKEKPAEEDKPKGRGSRKPSQDNAEEDKPKGRGGRKPANVEPYDGDDDPLF